MSLDETSGNKDAPLAMWAVQRRLHYQLTHHKTPHVRTGTWRLQLNIDQWVAKDKLPLSVDIWDSTPLEQWGRLPFQNDTLARNFGNFLNTLNAFTTLRAQMKEDSCSSCWEITRKKNKNHKKVFWDVCFTFLSARHLNYPCNCDHISWHAAVHQILNQFTFDCARDSACFSLIIWHELLYPATHVVSAHSMHNVIW